MTLIKGICQYVMVVVSVVCWMPPAFANEVQIDATHLHFQGGGATKIEVFAEDSQQPLFGELKSTGNGVTFVPAIPFVPARRYRVVLEQADGSKSNMEVSFAARHAAAPEVRLSPAVIEIPANTLKLYLDFTQPMEQGDFLQQITLKRQTGGEVVGAFRETELWSPDGKRLTIMFHPGRQKTGVNLNIDEGPVLEEGQGYQLVIAGRWRSADGVAIGQDAVFGLQAVAPDHEQPDPSKWPLSVPSAESRGPLTLTTDELFESEIFLRAIHVEKVAGTAKVEILPDRRLRWTFVPDTAWRVGGHVIRVDPELEDLAGNSPQKPFEVDLTAESPKARAKSITFGISERK